RGRRPLVAGKHGGKPVDVDWAVTASGYQQSKQLDLSRGQALARTLDADLTEHPDENRTLGLVSASIVDWGTGFGRHVRLSSCGPLIRPSVRGGELLAGWIAEGVRRERDPGRDPHRVTIRKTANLLCRFGMAADDNDSDVSAGPRERQD